MKTNDTIYTKYSFIIFMVILFFGIYSSCEAQTYEDTVAYDQMEAFNWSGNWWSGSPTTGFYTNFSKSAPASAVIYGTGGGADEYDWYVLPVIDTLDPMQEYKVQINLGSYRATSTGGFSGVDIDDYLDIQVSVDGGPYNSELRVTGNSNAYWEYNTKTITKVVNGSVDIYTPAGGGDRTELGDGFSVLELTFPLGTRQIAVDILAVVDRAGEEWWLDDMFLLGSGSGFSLPITLTSFIATQDGTSVDLSFLVHSQVNNDFFTIERSLDCYEWEDVGRIDGCGNCNLPRIYDFEDKQPYIGVSYYRLRQTDFDGKTEVFSPTSVTVKDESTITLKIKPNPAIDFIQLEMVYPETGGINSDIRIYNSSGNEVYKRFYIGKTGYIDIDISKYKPGLYIVKSKTNNKIIKGKFIKEYDN